MVSNISNNFQFTRDLWNQTVLSSMLTTTIILVFSSNLASAAMRVWTRRRLTNSLHALQAVVGMLIFCLLLVQIYIPKECDLIIGVYMMGSYVGTACLDGVLLLKAYYANRCWHPILIIGAILEMFRLIAFAFTTATNEVALSPWGTCITTSIGSAALFVRVCADVIQNIFLSLCFILPILRQSKLWIDARRATSLQHPTDRSLPLSPRAQPIAGIASVGYTTGKSTAITAFIGNQPVHPHASQRQNSDTRHNDRMLVTNRSRSDNVDAIQLHNNNHSHNGSGSNAGLSLSVANRISNTYHDRYTQTSNIQRVSQLADRAIQPAATSGYSTNAAYPPIRQHINSTPQPNKLVDNQPQRIYDQLVQDGAFYAFFVNVANLYCTAVVYWTLWGDLSSLAFIITWPLGSHLIHMQLNRVKQRESHASQRLAVNVPWHPPRSVAIPSARITPMMTSTTIYDHDDYANSTIVSQPFTASEWTNANDQCRFSLSSSMSSLSVAPAPASASMFSAVESPTSIIAYPLPSLNLTSTGISVDDYTNDNSNHIDTSIMMDNNCKYKAPSNNHSISSRSSNRNNRNTRRTSMPGIRHKPSYSFQTDSCVELNDKKYSIVYVGNSGATSLRLSKSLNPNTMKQHEASSIITTTGSHTPVKMMFPSLFSTAIGLTVNASRETCDTNNSSETKYQYRASSPSCISNDSPIDNNRHEYHYRLAEYATKRCSSSSF